MDSKNTTPATNTDAELDAKIENATQLARSARDAAAAADYRNREGSADRAEALKLHEDFIAAAAACRFHERALKVLLDQKVTT